MCIVMHMAIRSSQLPARIADRCLHINQLVAERVAARKALDRMHADVARKAVESETVAINERIKSRQGHSVKSNAGNSTVASAIDSRLVGL